MNYVALSEFHVLYDPFPNIHTKAQKLPLQLFLTLAVLMHPGPTTFFMQEEPISCFFYYNTIALLYQTLYFIEISKILNIVFL